MTEPSSQGRPLAHVAAVLLLWMCLAAQAQQGIRAVTQPSADITLSFVQPGRIARISCEEGDAVEAGQILVEEDSAAERVQLAQLEAERDNMTQIHASEASLAQKQVDLEKLRIAADHNAATPLEVQHAELEVKIAELSVELARFEQAQAARKYQEQQIRVDRMQLTCPIDGRIERVHVEVGESVNALGDVIRVVRIDPLWIDVPVPLGETSGLRRGVAARVQFLGADEVAAEGHITFVGAVADAASDTLRVRVAVPNDAGRPAGEHVLVTFSQ